MEIILFFEVMKKGKIEFFLGLFPSGFEGAFVGFRKYIAAHPEHFNLENIRFFPTKVGSGVSHAKYFCSFEEVEGVLKAADYLPNDRIVSHQISGRIVLSHQHEFSISLIN